MKKHKRSIIVFAVLTALITSISSGAGIFIRIFASAIIAAVPAGVIFVIEFIINFVKNRKSMDKTVPVTEQVSAIENTVAEKPAKIDTPAELTACDEKISEDIPEVEIADEETEEILIPVYNSFVALDFETATTAYKSACSLGIVKVVGKNVITKEYYLIQPPENFYLQDNINVHGITPDMTATLDTFPAVWDKIKGYFDKSYVIAHNANFDMSVLKATLHHYGIDYPKFYYIDSMTIGGWYLEKGKSKSLESMCECFNINLNSHHNALSDAEAVTEIVLHALDCSKTVDIGALMLKKDRSQRYRKSFEDINLKTEVKIRGHHTRAKDIQNTVAVASDKIDKDFEGKTFVFTGDVPGFTRSELQAKVVEGGGSVKDAVSKKVDILVNSSDVATGKLKRALELQEQGHHIKIITGEQFMQMLESTDAIEI